VVDPTTLQAGKPAPDIFIEAARGLGVDVKNCVGVEDAHAGIQAIKSAGMFAVGIGQHLADAECDLLLDDTSELSLDVLVAMLKQRA
jgi:beta-phosphoglucomutase